MQQLHRRHHAVHECRTCPYFGHICFQACEPKTKIGSVGFSFFHRQVGRFRSRGFYKQTDRNRPTLKVGEKLKISVGFVFLQINRKIKKSVFGREKPKKNDFRFSVHNPAYSYPNLLFSCKFPPGFFCACSFSELRCLLYHEKEPHEKLTLTFLGK